MTDNLGPVNRLAEFAGVNPALLRPYLLSSQSVTDLCLAFQSLGDGGLVVYAEASRGFLYDYLYSWLHRDETLLTLINEYRAVNGYSELEV